MQLAKLFSNNKFILSSCSNIEEKKSLLCVWEYLLTPGDAFSLGEITWFCKCNNFCELLIWPTWSHLVLKISKQSLQIPAPTMLSMSFEDSYNSMKRIIFPKSIFSGFSVKSFGIKIFPFPIFRAFSVSCNTSLYWMEVPLQPREVEQGTST